MNSPVRCHVDGRLAGSTLRSQGLLEGTGGFPGVTVEEEEGTRINSNYSVGVGPQPGGQITHLLSGVPRLHSFPAPITSATAQSRLVSQSGLWESCRSWRKQKWAPSRKTIIRAEWGEQSKVQQESRVSCAYHGAQPLLLNGCQGAASSLPGDQGVARGRESTQQELMAGPIGQTCAHLLERAPWAMPEQEVGQVRT